MIDEFKRREKQKKNAKLKEKPEISLLKTEFGILKKAVRTLEQNYPNNINKDTVKIIYNKAKIISKILEKMADKYGIDGIHDLLYLRLKFGLFRQYVDVLKNNPLENTSRTYKGVFSYTESITDILREFPQDKNNIKSYI